LDLKMKTLRESLVETEKIKNCILQARGNFGGSDYQIPTSSTTMQNNAHACFSPTAHEGNVYAEASDDRVRQAIDYQIASESDVPKVQATDNKRPASVVDNSKPTLAAMVANKQLVQQPGSPARRLSDGDSVSETDTSSSSSQSRTSSQSRSHIVEVDQHTNLTNGDDEVTSARPPFEVMSVFPYTSAEPDELEFNANIMITVLPWEHKDDEVDHSSAEPEPGWLYGKNEITSKTGLFPANYVKMLRKTIS